MILPGTRLGPYDIVGLLGSGGMGEVYRARDTRLGRSVALKVLPSAVRDDAESRARLEREARLVSSLHHPHICVLHDVGREGDVEYIVMELVEGESLAERLRRGPLAIGEALRIGAEIADALDCAHRAGVVHRDLKPANVMLAKSGAKLMDFGLARAPALSVRDEALTQSPTVAQPVTAEGAILGTFQYMAPEQIEGREADARSDLWALGCVLYEMVTGHRPFEGGSPASLMSSIMKDEPRPMKDLAPLTPSNLGRLVRSCLAKDPDQRWRSAHDLALLLRWPTDEAKFDAPAPAMTERELHLTAADVRQLEDRNPKLVGHRLAWLDNRRDSEELVVLLHGVGGDARRFERSLGASRRRSVAPTLLGFGPREPNRPSLGFDDHSRVLRIFLRQIVRECRPRRTVLVGFSAGSDQFLRMLHQEEGLGIEADALVALAPNVSLETCIASRVYARVDAHDPAATLASLKTLGSRMQSLPGWLMLQDYLAQTFIKFGSDLEPLRRYAAELVAPFESPGDPLADWYRSARRRVPRVRLVFSREEAGPAEALLSRHLETNALGDQFREDSFVFEPVHHVELADPDLVARHIEAVLSTPSA